MQLHGVFKRYRPQSHKALKELLKYNAENPSQQIDESQITFLASPEGADWYQLRDTVKGESILLVVGEDGWIKDHSEDPNQLWPEENLVAVYKKTELPEAFLSSLSDTDSRLKWALVQGKIVLRQAYLEEQRQRLLAKAQRHMQLWQAESSLGIIEDKSRAQLTEVVCYCKALLAADLKNYETWPEMPAFLKP